MTAEAVAALDDLARTDPTVAPLARRQAIAFRAATDSAWDACVPSFDGNRLSDGLPLLHGRALGVPIDVARGLLARLIEDYPSPKSLKVRGDPFDVCGDPLIPTEGVPAEGPKRGGQIINGIDVLGLSRAVIAQDEATLEEIAAGRGVETGLLATLGGLAALPLLLACGQAAAALLDGAPWHAGCCPVCAAWPALAELRGLDRQRWLRCGRCGSGWHAGTTGCPFCENDDFRTLGYLAPEAEAEARRAVTCDRCHGYLKTLTTFAPLSPVEIAVRDLTTLELDMAALERGYARPEMPALPLNVQVEAAARPSRGNGWTERLGWRR